MRHRLASLIYEHQPLCINNQLEQRAEVKLGIKSPYSGGGNWKTGGFIRMNLRPPLQTSPTKQNIRRANTGGTAMRVLAATLALLVSSAAAAQECQTCSMADSCIKTYVKATSEAQTATKQAIRDWKQNLDRKASAELSSRGTVALKDAMETQVRLELERLKECLANIR
jgi:hypothetical protein